MSDSTGKTSVGIDTACFGSDKVSNGTDTASDGAGQMRDGVDKTCFRGAFTVGVDNKISIIL